MTVMQPSPDRQLLRGDTVRVVGLPPGAGHLPGEVRGLFAAVIGQTLRVDDVNDVTGCLALNVYADGSQAEDWCQHTIWIEPQCAVRVSAKADGGVRP